MNLLTMKQRLQRRTNGDDSSIPTGAATKWTDYLNEAQRALLRQQGMESLRYGTLTVASVANQQAYALPAHGIERINRIWETTNDYKLEYRSLEWLRRVDPDPRSGTPAYWIPTGYAEVHTQPSDASEIFVKSSAAGDTTQTAYIEGIITGGYYRTASVTLTGTTAVSLSATITSFIQITKFYLSATCAGNVTLHEDSGSGTELAKIVIGDTRAQFLQFLLYPTPSAVITYTLDVLRAVPEMSNDTDEPLLPFDFHDLLIDKAELKNTKKADDPARYAMLTAEIKRAEADLRSFVTSHPDWTPAWGGEAEAQRSSLGAWFPAGT